VKMTQFMSTYLYVVVLCSVRLFEVTKRVMLMLSVPVLCA